MQNKHILKNILKSKTDQLKIKPLTFFAKSTDTDAKKERKITLQKQ